MENTLKPAPSGKQYKLVNAYEYSVRNAVLRLIQEDPEMCRCEKCYLDVCAIVMNDGFSRYVTTDKGEMLTMLPSRADNRDVELYVKAMNAIKMVKAQPNH